MKFHSLAALAFSLSLGFAASPAWADSENNAGEGDLGALVQIALAKNPSLRALESEAKALEHKAKRAGAWKDPTLMLAYQNAPVDSFALGREPMTMAMLRLEQTIPMAGKTAKRRGVLLEAARGKRWSVKERKNRLRTAVKRAYYQLALSRQLKSITQTHITLTAQLLDVVRSKYQVGKAEQQNVLRLQVRVARLKDDIKDFERTDTELTSAINRALHRKPDVAIKTPASLVLPKPPAKTTAFVQKSSEERPALKQLMSSASMHRAAGKLAKAEAAPDITVFVGYGLRTALPGDNPGRDLVTVGVSIPVPIFYGSRYRAEADASYARARSSDYARSALSDDIQDAITRSHASWTRMHGKVKTYKDTLIPGAKATLAAARSNYQVDRTTFLQLYESELELLNFEKTIRRSIAQGLIAQAEIEMQVGGGVQ